MVASSIGSGIDPAPAEFAPQETTIGEGIEQAVESVFENVQEPQVMDLQTIRNLIHDEMTAAVADVERRLAQARELEQSALYGADRQIHAEDLNLVKHMIDGYTLTANSPAAGSIAWSSLHVVLAGVDYTIADGNTANKYAWFVKPGSGTTATLQTGNSLPTLGANDALLFVNNGGTPVSVLESSITYALAAGTVGSAQVQDGAITSAKTDFYGALSAAITNAQNTADLAKSTADGAINTYFQAAQPWAPGATHTPDRIGDIWYDSDDGQAYRWSGNGGTWVMIEDSNIGAALTAANNAQAKADIKITTYYAANASPPAAPTPPAGNGFTTGDMWVVTDQNNKLRRWSGSAWVDVLLGDAAISGIGGSKVGSGINGDNVTTGTVVAARIGSGVNGANLSTATGTIGTSKLNTAFHMLY